MNVVAMMLEVLHVPNTMIRESSLPDCLSTTKLVPCGMRESALN